MIYNEINMINYEWKRSQKKYEGTANLISMNFKHLLRTFINVLINWKRKIFWFYLMKPEKCLSKLENESIRLIHS